MKKIIIKLKLHDNVDCDGRAYACNILLACVDISDMHK